MFQYVRALNTRDHRGEPVILGDHVECRAILDSGADVSVVSQDLVSKLKSTALQIKMESIEEPFYLLQAFDQGPGEKSICITKKLISSITLRTAAGLVRLTEAHLFVVEVLKSTFIIGRPELEKIGIDPHSLLKSHNVPKIRLLRTESSLQNKESHIQSFIEDEVETANNIPSVSAEINHAALKKSIENMLERCLTNGATKEYVAS